MNRMLKGLEQSAEPSRADEACDRSIPPEGDEERPQESIEPAESQPLTSDPYEGDELDTVLEHELEQVLSGALDAAAYFAGRSEPPPAGAAIDTIIAAAPSAGRAATLPAPSAPVQTPRFFAGHRAALFAGEVHAAFRKLRDAVFSQMPGEGPLAIALVAADEHAERQVDMLQVARAFTGSPRGNVLLVEADLAVRHSPDLVRDGACAGLSELLAGSGDLDHLAVKTPTAGLSILPRGSDLVAGAEPTVDPLLVSRWKRHYGLVLIDAGRCDGPYVVSLARQCDAAYLLVALHRTPRAQADQAIRLLQRGGVRIQGCAVAGPAA